MDKYGYPEKRELEKIAKWNYKDIAGLMEYVEERWRCGYWYRGRKYYRISTGGWSGNEDIIEALMKNRMFWMCCWVQSRRGGHYIFEVKRWKNVT